MYKCCIEEGGRGRQEEVKDMNEERGRGKRREVCERVGTWEEEETYVDRSKGW